MVVILLIHNEYRHIYFIGHLILYIRATAICEKKQMPKTTICPRLTNHYQHSMNYFQDILEILNC